MARGRKWIEMDPKECESDSCSNTFERRTNQTCAQFRAQKYCSRECGYANQRRLGSAKQKMCGKKLHELAGDNLYVDHNGYRRCKACIKIRDAARADRKPGARSATGATRLRPRSVPSVEIPDAPPREPRPKWRPAGFTPEPKTFTGRRAT